MPSRIHAVVHSGPRRGGSVFATDHRHMKKSTRLEVEAGPAESVVDAESFGVWLRRQREGRDIGLREIAQQSKISLRYLQALEAGRFAVLPAPVFAKGFLRQYAAYVGLDTQEVVNAYLAARRLDEPEEDHEAVPVPPAARRDGRTRALLLVLAILGLTVILLLVYVADRWRRAQPPAAAVPERMLAAPSTPATTPPATPSPVPDAAAAPQAPSAARSPLIVGIDFAGECWIEATADGRKILAEMRVQGESVQLSADQRIELTLGDTSVVTIEVNGRPMPLTAPPGRVRSLVIDLERARALAAAPDSQAAP